MRSVCSLLLSPSPEPPELLPVTWTPGELQGSCCACKGASAQHPSKATAAIRREFPRSVIPWSLRAALRFMEAIRHLEYRRGHFRDNPGYDKQKGGSLQRPPPLEIVQSSLVFAVSLGLLGLHVQRPEEVADGGGGEGDRRLRGLDPRRGGWRRGRARSEHE